ncbi:MAG: diacylglycerol kinase family protein, partial [Roseiflexaceae bacterium]|nr:diacylglycerol kinase family protein [Roseiflexaceae bacterium]
MDQTDERNLPSTPLVARPSRAATLLLSFRYAFSGLWYLLSTQRNAQIHCIAAIAATALGFAFGITRTEWAVLVLTCALVLATEGANTAIEAAVDLASPEFHVLAKTAKDVAAGTVLLAAIAAVIVGLIVLGPHVWAGLG